MTEPLRRRVPVAIRMALFYATSYFSLGVITPFLPVWLDHRGLSAAEIPVVLAGGLFIRLIGNTAWGRLADYLGERRRLLMALTVISLATHAALLPAQGFWAILAAYLAASLAFPAQVALTENVGVLAAYQRGYDYARVRLWGSVSFVLGTLAIGQLMPLTGVEGVLWVILAGLGLSAATAWLVPDVRPPPAQRSGLVRGYLTNRLFLLFLGVNALVQGSHAAYYSYSALHWREAGHDDFTIGLLWTEGVAFEIALFALAKRLLPRVKPTTLMLLGGFGGILRWTVIGVTTDLTALVLVQWMHAMTFAMAHLGAMHFIARACPDDATATAQGLYSSLGIAVSMACATLSLSLLIGPLGGGVFLVMAAMCAASCVVAATLRRTWDGSRLAI